MNGEKQNHIFFEEFELDTAQQKLLRSGKPVSLYAKTFELLTFLAQNSGRILTKDEILEKVWEGQFVEEANLSVQISALRKALGETTSQPRFLITIPGKGYKFIGDVQNSNGEIVIEKHKLSRVIIEETEESENTNIELQTSDKSNKGLFNQSKSLFLGIAVSLLVFLGLAFGIYNFSKSNYPYKPFEKPILSRLTNSGLVDCVTLSPDGNYVAYVLGEKDGNGLWLKQVDAGKDIQILKPQKATFRGITFSPDGKSIYYSLFAPENIDYQLFRVPILGGIEESIPNVSTTRVAFSSDGEKIAFIQTNSVEKYNYLSVSDKNGKNQQVVAKKEYPNTFYQAVNAVSWSPIENLIATLVSRYEEGGSYTEIVGVNPNDGTEKILSKKHWFEIGGVEWLKDGSGLIINAKESPSSDFQIWFVAYPSGETRKITNDLNQYSEITVASDNKTLVAIQENTVKGIFVGEFGKENPQEIASEVGSLNPLVWNEKNEIIYRSKKDGDSNLWKMEVDGNNPQQLTKNAQVDSRGLCLSSDGKYIVFASWRSGKLNIWRADSDGKNLTQLTNGKADAYPRCSFEGKTVLFQRGIFSEPRLLKVSINGGETENLTDFSAKWGAISNDGEEISYFKMHDDKWRIGFVSKDGEDRRKLIDVPNNHKNSTVIWAKDNKSIFYIGADGGVGNIYSLSIDKKEIQKLTDFNSQWISDFSVSPSEKSLAVTRSRSFRDVVLIENKENLAN